MPEQFSVSFDAVASGTNKSMANIYDSVAAPTRRAKIAEYDIGSADTPGDQAAKFVANRTTAIGTATSYTPNNLDPAGPAGECSAGVAHSAEPTYTSSKELLKFALNQRATFRWVAIPGYELICAATQNNGIGLKSLTSTSTQTYSGTVLFQE